MRTYFTFGAGHAHRINGVTFDPDIAVEIVADDPRGVMFDVFGQKWGHEYDRPPESRFVPRGVFKLTRAFHPDIQEAEE